ncbi:MAG TPA: sialidase family protein [Thermoanaerobaculia bacterium]|nr:sialidase family protein [Thermoanaerobaculia bacterium]
MQIPSKFAPLPVVEPQISAHPSDPNRLLVAAMVVTEIDNPYESSRLSSFASSDGGATWRETAHDYWGYDPWTALFEDGRALLAWIGTPGQFLDRYPVVFFNSDDAGESWKGPVHTLRGGYDGTKLVTDGPRAYFTTLFFGDSSMEVQLYRIEGKSAPHLAGSISGRGGHLAFAEPAMVGDGAVLVPAIHLGSRAWVQRLDAGGALSGPVEITRRLGDEKGYSCLVSDRSSSRFRDRVYYVRATGFGRDHGGIWVNASSDGGKTWGADTRVDAFADPSRSAARVPAAAVNKDGVLGITWSDSQHDSNRKQKDVYFSASLDGGATFLPPVRLTSVSSDPRTRGNADVANKFPGGGHYLGLAARADGTFQAVWSDSRGGVFALQTCTVRVKGP